MENDKKRISGIVYVIASVIVVAAIVTAIVLWKNSGKPSPSSDETAVTVTSSPSKELTPTATATPTVTPTATPTTTPTAEPTLTVTPTGTEEIIWDEAFWVTFVTDEDPEYRESVAKFPDVPLVIPNKISTRAWDSPYVFEGWYDVENPDVLYVPGSEYNENRDIELRERWKQVSEEERELVSITLSGNREDHVITDRYSVYEGEKFFLFLDKDLDIPGDFGDNIELIMETLENEIGFTFDVFGREERMYFGSSLFGGTDPWRAVDNGTKQAIYVIADRTDEHMISYASAGAAVFVMYELFSDELWNSVESYRENDWRRGDDIYYDMIAHELTHSLTNRYYEGITRIMTEGSAEYYAELAITALKDHSKDFQGRYSMVEALKNEWIDETITKDNAETFFADDYRDLSHANRGDEYTFGRVFCEFLGEKYGATFMKKYLEAAKERGLGSQYCSTNNNVEPEKHAALMKELFGDDVFVKFAEWLDGSYQK